MSVPAIPTKLWLALKSRVSAITLNGQSIDKAWPAQPYQPRTVNGTPLPYISVGRATARPVRLQVGSGKERLYEGSLILTLVQPLIVSTTGVSTPEEAYVERAAQLAAYFPEDSRLNFMGVCLRITSEPFVGDGYQDQGYWRIPVTVDWRSVA